MLNPCNNSDSRLVYLDTVLENVLHRLFDTMYVPLFHSTVSHPIPLIYSLYFTSFVRTDEFLVDAPLIRGGDQSSSCYKQTRND